MVGKDLKAKKRYGQNFLIKEEYINSIIEAISVFPNDLIIEIGPGRGALTKKIKTLGAKVIAYEIDTDLKSILNQLEDENTQIIYQDFLEATKRDIFQEYNKLHIVGNLPYYITTPIIEHIIKENFDPIDIIIMVQKEVADRLLAKPHNKEYGYFTLYLKYHFTIERIVDVPRTAFSPIPKVESTVIKLTKRSIMPDIDFPIYNNFLKDCFRQKRKQLKNNLQAYNWTVVEEVLKTHQLSENVRAEELSEEVLVEICQKLTKNL